MLQIKLIKRELGADLTVAWDRDPPEERRELTMLL